MENKKDNIGIFMGTNKGYGFIELSDSEEKYFVPPKYTNGALNSDIVMFEIYEEDFKGRKAIARVIKVVKRKIKKLIGTYNSVKDKEGNIKYGFVVPDDINFGSDIFLSKNVKLDEIEDNSKVECEIINYSGKNPEGKITKVLGKKGDKFAELQSIILRYGLRDEFPEKVINDARRVSTYHAINELDNRVDLRDLNIFTIDGDDAKDLDDAIHIKKINDKLWELGVHIADVSHYVKEKSKLDIEALKRSTSVYLVDKVIPMLPKELSNGSCSLHPGEPKLTLSCIMKINNQGKVVDYDIIESIIESKTKFTYDKVYKILANDEEIIKEYDQYKVNDLKICKELAEVLMKKRDKRGALDFQSVEDKITLNDNEDVIDIKPYPRTIANRIIEEFMLITNETIAEHFYWLETPFVYRVHEDPTTEKMEELSKIISAFGYNIKGGIEDIKPKALQTILKQIEGKEEETIINSIMLRSLKQAKYKPQCEGHFGLAANYYCHFTSPIRRYPDLQIHRIIKDSINNRINSKRDKKYREIVNIASEKSSINERIAEKAEEDVHAFYRAKYMSCHKDDVFEGTISNITSNYIVLMINGIIKCKLELSSLTEDFFIYNKEKFELYGENTNKTIKIGNKMNVILDRIDPINFDVFVKEVNNEN